MRVRDILRHKGSDVVTINAGATIHDAIGRLNQHGIGALIVIGEAGQISGIITERDILRACGERCASHQQSASQEHSPCLSPVDDVMTTDVIIGVPDDDLRYVMGVMTTNRIRHLPVLDDRRVVGIVSIGDIVNAQVEETDFENRMLKAYMHAPPPSRSGSE